MADSTAPYKTYSQYFADRPEAMKYTAYQSPYTPGQREALSKGMSSKQDWGATGDPFRFGEEYNQYRSTLAPEYSTLAAIGIDPADVMSGKITGVLGSTGITPVGPNATAAADEAKGIYGGPGTGSRHVLSPDILAKMWR